MKILSPETFEKHFGPLHRSIFSGRPVSEGCFINPCWEMVLVPYGLNFEDTTYRALASAAQQVGDHTVVITDIERTPPHEETVVIPWIWETLQGACDKTLLAALDCAFFGSSGKWGGVVMQSEDGYTCIGGDEEFMSVFVAEAGGLNAMKQRFFEFAQTEWCLDQREKEKILKVVGWLSTTP